MNQMIRYLDRLRSKGRVALSVGIKSGLCPLRVSVGLGSRRIAHDRGAEKIQIRSSSSNSVVNTNNENQ